MTEDIKTIAETQTESFPLDDAAIGLIAELDCQGRCVDAARAAVLNYFARQHNLSGEWRLSPDRRELTRTH
jgi:hypothetical protein